MKTVGEILKEKREERELTIKEISSATNISPNYIKAIESNDFSLIPGETYVIGFMRNYAEYLDLNSEDIVAKYKEFMRYEQDIPLEMLTKDDHSDIIRIIIRSVIVVLLIAVIVFLIFSENPVKTGILSIIKSIDNSSKENITNSNNPTNSNNSILSEDIENNNAFDIDKIRDNILNGINSSNISITLSLLRPYQNYVITYQVDEDDQMQKILSNGEIFQLFGNNKILLKLTDASSIEIKISANKKEKIISGNETFKEMAGQIVYFELIYDDSTNDLIINEKGMNMEQIIIPGNKNSK